MATDGAGTMATHTTDLIIEEDRILIDQEFQEEVITHIEITIQEEQQLQEDRQLLDAHQTYIETVEVLAVVFVELELKEELEMETVIRLG